MFEVGRAEILRLSLLMLNIEQAGLHKKRQEPPSHERVPLPFVYGDLCDYQMEDSIFPARLMSTSTTAMS